MATSSNRRALSLAMVSVLSGGFVPLLIDITAPTSNPFFFNAILCLGQVFLFIVFLTSTYSIAKVKGRFSRTSLWSLHNILLYWDNTHSPPIPQRPSTFAQWIKTPAIWGIVGIVSFGLFILATTRAETAVIVTIYQLWPLSAIFLLSRLGTKLGPATTASPHHISKEQFVLIAFAFVGVALVILSQTASFPFTLTITTDPAALVFAFGAAFLGSLSAPTSVSIGHILYTNLSAVPETDETQPESLQVLWFTIYGLTWIRFIALFVNLGLSIVAPGLGLSDQTGLWHHGAFVGALLVAVVDVVSMISVRWSLHTSPDLGHQGILYFGPIVSLVYLAAFRGIDVPRLDLLILGAALIVAVNVLIHSDPDHGTELGSKHRPSFGFKALILALWIAGTSIHLRDEVFPIGWLDWEGGIYWGVIGLSATVFILIFGFRVSRLTGRITKEEDLMLGVFRNTERLVYDGQLSPSLLTLLERMYYSPRLIRNYYDKIQRELAYRSEHTSEVRRDITDIRILFDQFSHSRQLGRDYSELAALWGFATITIVLGLAGRPAGIEALTGFLTDVFTILFVATIAFLAFNLFDIRKSREWALIRPGSAIGRGAVRIRYGEQVRWPRIWATVIILGLCLLFGVLLYDRWLVGTLL